MGNLTTTATAANTVTTDVIANARQNIDVVDPIRLPLPPLINVEQLNTVNTFENWLIL